MRRKLRVCPGALVALLLWVTGPLEGQETIRGEVLPEEVAADVLGFVNDPGTLRFEGDGRVPSGQSIQGNVALVGGLLTVAGEIRGDLVILNGDLVLLPSAVITGDVLIVGGEVAEGDADAIQGLVSIYERAYPVVRRDGGVYPRTDRRRERPGIYLGGSRITIRSGSGYNRVEGLPILVGPLFRTSGDYPLRVEALAIFRTESGFSLDNLGYTVRLEQSFGAAPRWTLGAGAASEVVPIQGRGVSDLEASLSTFLLHRDNRDYLSREGWFLSLAADFESIPLRTSLTFRADDHYSTTPGSPWTLFRNDEEWRPMPLVAEGDLRTLEAQVEIDRRNDPDNPTDGWFLEASLTHGLDGDLFLPAYIAAGATAPEGPTPVDPRFTFGSLDLRRYARIDPNSDLRFRLLLQGALQSDALLPQFQSALGGVGTLPGYRRFELDCGARTTPAEIPGGEEDDATRTAFVRYGCDQTALFQMEFREVLDWELDLSPDNEEDWEEWHWYPRVDFTTALVAFLDAGRGWSKVPDGVDSDTLADIGAGAFIGDLGLFLAYPLTGDDRKVRFFVRLQHRF
jgi:hypothetical protein